MATSGIRFNQIKASCRQGNADCGQAFGGGSTNAGEFVLYDANGNVVSSGAKGTAKGDLLVYDGSAWTPLRAGTDGDVLTARSGASTGVDWEAASGGGSSGTNTETPSGTMDGSNLTFTLAHTPIMGLFLNGVWQRPVVDYILSASTITYTVAPKSTDTHTASY